MGEAAFDHSEQSEERRRMVRGLRRIDPTEDDAHERMIRRIQRLEAQRQRAILLYPLPSILLIRGDHKSTKRVAVAQPSRWASWLRRCWSASRRWLMHPVAEWDV